MQQPSEKLQKILANFGLGSRRMLERIISEGRVAVNGKIATLGERALPTDTITIDGRLVRKSEKPRRRVLAYYKPAGEICSQNDPEGRISVFDKLPPITQGRWIMVGRLDLNSSGLLLFTNDGELANRLMHPSYQIERVYLVRALGTLDDAQMRALTTGVMLDDGMAKFDDLRTQNTGGANIWYRVVLREGKKREVRRLFESQGLKVSRLLRIQYATYELPKILKTGRHIELDAGEVGRLAQSVDLSSHGEMGARIQVRDIKRHHKAHSARELRRLQALNKQSPSKTHRNGAPQDSASKNSKSKTNASFGNKNHRDYKLHTDSFNSKKPR